MDMLSARLGRAKEDRQELNQLMEDYMPFVKSEVSKTLVAGMDFDDRLSIAMLVFMNCVRQYEESRGAFFAYAAVAIRNRLIDERRRYHAKSRAGIVLIGSEEEMESLSAAVSIQEYNQEEERRGLQEEIGLLSKELESYHIPFSSLSAICPKQARSRRLCLQLARELVRDKAMLERFFTHRRLPQTELARRGGVSEKTVEKYRRYIIALAVILSGDYPGVRAFLPEEGGGAV